MPSTAELFRPQTEFVKRARARHSRASGGHLKADGAGKGGAIKRITEYLNPRVALYRGIARADRERGRGTYQRYIAHLPAKGDSALDRSWYNRAGVEKVSFCTPQEWQTSIFE